MPSAIRIQPILFFAHPHSASPILTQDLPQEVSYVQPIKKIFDGCHVQTILIRNHGLSNGSIYLEFKCEFCGLLRYLRFSFELLLDLTEKWKRPENSDSQRGNHHFTVHLAVHFFGQSHGLVFLWTFNSVP